ncbi:hypothetical protein MHLNE_06540 [Moorella humiferrea]|uniref:hypothetical protein n=1 Tax=Neomoorella humiferrea TaxID=676965 RepID=UPI0030D27567
MIKTLNKILGILSYFLGAAVVLEALIKGVRGPSPPQLYIALAIIIVGPVEDLANYLIGKSKLDSRAKELYKELVNQLTSLAFLILLGLVVRRV